MARPRGKGQGCALPCDEAVPRVGMQGGRGTAALLSSVLPPASLSFLYGTFYYLK